MAKTLNQFIEGYLKVKNPDEQKFVDKHVVAKHSDRNGNDDAAFKGKTKQIDRRKERHGYNPGEDEKVYEELKGNQHKIDANKNGKIDAQDFKHLRKKKKVAEEAEQIDELDTATLKSYRKKARAQGNAIVDKMKMGGGDWSKDQKDTKTLRKRAAGAQMSGKQLVKRGESLKTEEAEELDELSKSTLATYAQKAKNQMGRDEYRAGVRMGQRDGRGQDEMEKAHSKRADKRHKGLTMAIDKLAKESTAAYGKSIEDMRRDRLTQSERDNLKKLHAMMAKEKKPVKEEVEELEELSKGTMGRYINKAKDVIDTVSFRQGMSDLPANHPRAKRYERQLSKRHKGVETAVKKLTKEESELEEKLSAKSSMGTYIKDFQKSDAPQFKGKSQEKRRAMAIAAKLTAERGGKALRKEEKLANLLDDLAENDRRTMLSVFDKLNEDNQKKFLEACETPEGVELMLDFAISHRGE